jgi:hypothetical protein
LLGIVYAYKLGNHVWGPKAGFFSALFLAVMPGFYGQMFNDSKDIPFAALFSIALYNILRTYNQLPKVSYRLVVEVGVAIGLALGVRIGGIILLGYLLFFWATWLFIQWIKGLSSRHDLLVLSIKLTCTFILTVIIAWTLMMIWWPWAQVSPLAHPFAAMKATAHFRWPLTVFFNGDFIAGPALPWTYLPTWLLISLPEFYFIALALGVLLASKTLIEVDKELPQPDRLIKIGLLALAGAFPIFSALILHATMYDGLRQFLFVLPCISALAGVSFVSFLESRTNKWIKLGAAATVLISVSLTVLDMIQLHPYQYVYFNRLFAGGLRSAAERFETDYWGSSYKEGAEWVINNYRPNSAQPIRVAHCGLPFLIRYFFEKTGNLRQRFMVVKPDENPDIYLGITRWQCHKVFDGKLLHIVQRKGTPLLYIIEVQGSYRPEALRKKAKGFSW